MIRTNESLIMAGASYVAPSVDIQTLQSEGLLCQSVSFDRVDVDYGFNDLGEI